ncbi:MAG: hypothetical protein KF819_32560 [Labilithrix sp.]|nr:hypothetical protein [Labilithrix sp.]
MPLANLLRAGGLALAMFADVMPHCGGPDVVVQSPGQDCGYHGPRWKGECRAPAMCFQLEKGGAACSVACEKDVDCTTLGAGFTCTGRGSPYFTNDKPPPRSVCSNANMSR